MPDWFQTVVIAFWTIWGTIWILGWCARHGKWPFN